MKKLITILTVISTILTLGFTAFATEYKVVDKKILVQKEIPTYFTYDKTCYRAIEVDGNYKYEYLGKMDKDWVQIDLDTYIKEYEERNSLGITY